MRVILVLSGTALASLLSPAASDHHLDGLNVVCLHKEINRLISTFLANHHMFHVSSTSYKTVSIHWVFSELRI